jgi:hypothetical protein
MRQSSIPQELSDSQLLAEVNRLAKAECAVTADFVAALAEMDERRLYLGQGCSSMFTYCTQILHLAEHATFNRIEAARAARRFPIILTLLADGRVHLSAVRLLAPHLTEANHHALLTEASHKSKREIEQIVARLVPRLDVSTSVRKVPFADAPVKLAHAPIQECASTEVGQQCIVAPAPVRRPETQPLAPGRYKLQFTVGEDTYQKLRRAQDLLRHRMRNPDAAVIFDRALTLFVADLEKQKLAATERPRKPQARCKQSRHIPASVRRAVWARDGGRCRFEGPAGRCAETGLVEFHHVVPYAHGGPATVDNLELRCAGHNRYEAAQSFGLFVRETGQEYEGERRTALFARDGDAASLGVLTSRDHSISCHRARCGSSGVPHPSSCE